MRQFGVRLSCTTLAIQVTFAPDRDGSFSRWRRTTRTSKTVSWTVTEIVRSSLIALQPRWQCLPHLSKRKRIPLVH